MLARKALGVLSVSTAKISITFGGPFCGIWEGNVPSHTSMHLPGCPNIMQLWITPPFSGTSEFRRKSIGKIFPMTLSKAHAMVQ